LVIDAGIGQEKRRFFGGGRRAAGDRRSFASLRITQSIVGFAVARRPSPAALPY